MRRLLMLSAAAVFVSALAFAETFDGNLVDAHCAQHQRDAACIPTASTKAFAIQASGKLLKLDAEGNRKAADALRGTNSADRAKDPTAAAAQVTATVQGTLSGDEIKVDSIVVH